MCPCVRLSMCPHFVRIIITFWITQLFVAKLVFDYQRGCCLHREGWREHDLSAWAKWPCLIKILCMCFKFNQLKVSPFLWVWVMNLRADSWRWNEFVAIFGCRFETEACSWLDYHLHGSPFVLETSHDFCFETHQLDMPCWHAGFWMILSHSSARFYCQLGHLVLALSMHCRLTG